jgi:hypothetical protein
MQNINNFANGIIFSAKYTPAMNVIKFARLAEKNSMVGEALKSLAIAMPTAPGKCSQGVLL